MGYDPQQGRWISADPLGYPDGANRYQAFSSSPVLFRDPLGLKACNCGPDKLPTSIPVDARQVSVTAQTLIAGGFALSYLGNVLHGIGAPEGWQQQPNEFDGQDSIIVYWIAGSAEFAAWRGNLGAYIKAQVDRATKAMECGQSKSIRLDYTRPFAIGTVTWTTAFGRVNLTASATLTISVTCSGCCKKTDVKYQVDYRVVDDWDFNQLGPKQRGRFQNRVTWMDEPRHDHWCIPTA